MPITENTARELPLVWPSLLPFSTTFELANHPVLDTIRSVLFPSCYPGTYLFVVRDTLEIILAGAHSEPQRPSTSRGLDGAKLVATVIVTLPVRFRGGALKVCNPEGDEERFFPPAQFVGAQGEMQLPWTAFLADCEHEVEYVEQGSRMSIKYSIWMKTFGPVGQKPNPLITPHDQLLDALSPILNLSRGQRLGIYLTGKYDCSPADVLADSLVPSASEPELPHGAVMVNPTCSLKVAMSSCTTRCGSTSSLRSSAGLQPGTSGLSTRQCSSMPISIATIFARSHAKASTTRTACQTRLSRVRAVGILTNSGVGASHARRQAMDRTSLRAPAGWPASGLSIKGPGR